MSTFKRYWKDQVCGEGLFEKDKLSQAEIGKVREIITYAQKRKLPSSKTISTLQKRIPKLQERWKAERAYWTEVKREDTQIVGQTSQELDIGKYRVILSPHACTLCVKKSNNGKKVFKDRDINKSGYGQFVPWHPNCFCIAIPVI